MSQKVASFQSLRGIAILLVFIFHLYPKLFQNGFIGVDIFFVLSGYLMTRILKKNLKISGFLEFYKKRFCRILPLYYITILFTIFGVSIFVIKNDRQNIIRDIKWSAALILNFQPIFEHHSYWELVSSCSPSVAPMLTSRFFTHFWSICVEVQYYLMAPFIHLIGDCQPIKIRCFSYLFFINLSFFFQCFTPFELSYSFIFSRIWQFLMGSLAFELWNLNESQMKNQSKYKTIFFDIFPFFYIIFIVFLMLFPHFFNEIYARLIITILTSFFCFLGNDIKNPLFCNKILIFIGNISYDLYLIHWPIISFVRYVTMKEQLDLSLTDTAFSILITLILALLMNFFFENYFVDSKNVMISLATVVLGCSLSFASLPALQNTHCLLMKTLDNDLQEKLMWNDEPRNLLTEIAELPCLSFYELSIPELRNDSGTFFCKNVSSGNGTAMIIGNSLAVRAFPVLFQWFNGKFKELRLFARLGSAPLFNLYPPYTKACIEMVNKFKPDMLWIIQGANEIQFGNEKINKTSYQEIVQSLSKNSKIVIIDLPYFLTKENVVQRIARNTVYRQDLDPYLAFDHKTVYNQINPYSAQLLNVSCSNCFFNDVQSELTGNLPFYRLYEPKTLRPILYDGSHLSLTGLKYLKNIYETRIQQFHNL